MRGTHRRERAPHRSESSIWASGAFHRSHQAYFTQLCDPQREWGIAAFTGRSPHAADELSQQGGLYTLLVRSADGDSASVVDSIVEARDGADLARFCELLAAPTTALVTLTLTEAGYRVRPDGEPDVDDPSLQADLELLRAAATGTDVTGTDAAPTSALARLVLGLDARRRHEGGPVAVVPCDNLPSNGPLVRNAVVSLARMIDGGLAAWIESNVSFVSTSVDRITPRLAPGDVLAASKASGWYDRCPVVAEPFADWVLSGDFPAGRPEWELAGARFVEDIVPFEQRKLRMLNGAHTLLATAGRLLGHETVAAATADPRCAAWLEEYWDEAAEYLPDRVSLDLAHYRERLRERFLNPRIEHRLAQIAEDTPTKLRLRVVPTLRAAWADGSSGSAGARVVAAWMLAEGVVPTDARLAEIALAVHRLDPALADSLGFLEILAQHLADLHALRAADPIAR